MSTMKDTTGQVIKRLSFGDTALQHLVHEEEGALQHEHDLGDGGDCEPENDENTPKDAEKEPGLPQGTRRDRQANYQRALEEIRTTSTRFNALEELAKRDYREAGPGKLASLKDEFSKSKFEYVELETKEHFVRAIAEEGDKVLAGEEVKSSFLLEGVVENQKAKVQDLKRLKEQTGLSISNIIDQIAAEMGELDKEQDVLARELESCEKGLHGLEQLQETLVEAQTGQATTDLEGLHMQLEAQLQRIAKQEMSAQQAGAQEKQEADQVAGQMAELQARLEEAEAESLRLEEAAEQVRRVSKSTKAYEQMLELVHDLAGVHLSESTDNQLRFRVTTHVSSNDKTGNRKHAAFEHDVTVDLHAASCSIRDVNLRPDDVDISDIVETVRGTHRLDVLVREVRQRMRCYALRASLVGRTSRATRYKMKADRNDMIQVALPGTNIQAFVNAPYDWPTPGVALQLESLRKRDGGEPAFQEEVFQSILERVNTSSAAQAGDLIPFLQIVERELQVIA